MNSLGKISKPRAMRDSFLESVYKEMLQDPNVFFVTADFGSPILDKIRFECPSRFVNVGIAEQNLINVSAGLALEGFKVFSYAIAPFITMRCFEQIRVNLALMSEVRAMNVNLVGVGAGYSYVVSGPTHQCYEDLTLMRALPNMQVYSISDEVMASKMPAQALLNKGLKYFRLDAQVLPILAEGKEDVFNDGFFVKRSGGDICLIATGYMVHTALQAAELLSKVGITVSVIDIFNLTTFNEVKLAQFLSNYLGLVSMEEAFPGRGGLDSMLHSFLLRNDISLKILCIGVEGGYRFEIGSREDLHEFVGIGVNAVVNKVSNLSLKLKK